MAHNVKLTSQILPVFIKVITSYQKKVAKKCGIKRAKTGSVTFIQRFGSALNLNVHFHALFTDGVFFKTDGGYEFYKLPAPTKEELIKLASKIYDKVEKLLNKIGVDQDQMGFDEDALNDLAAISIRHKAGFGERAGQGLRRYGIKRIEVDPEGDDPYSANVGGFSLNAKVSVCGREREKLEKLIRYMARGPIASERLSELLPNSLIYKMKTRWKDGTMHVSFSHLDFIARLVALVPPAKMNLVRYHGVFAPNFKDRAVIVPLSPKPKPASEELGTKDALLAEKLRRERMRWSDMLKRTFEIDVTICKTCGGRMEQIAVIKDKVVAKAILASLRETSVFRPLEVIWERGPPDPCGNCLENEYDQRGSW